MANLLNFRLTLEDLFGPKLASLADRLNKFTRDVDKPHKVKVDTSQASGGLSSLAGMAGRAFAAIGIFEGVKGILKMGSDLEQTRVQFETFTGSAEKGNQVIADLQKFAQITPFEDDQVISAGRQLLAFGEKAEGLNPILSKLGNISSATGKDFNELVSLWGKNKLSGIIQGEDLNQLVDSGIPVMDSLAKQLGVNTSQVRKMGEQGKITFAMLDKSFDELGGPAGKWGNLMEKQSQTLAGRWSSLVGFAQNMGGKMGEALIPFMGAIVDGGNKLLTFVSENGSKIMQMFAPLVDSFQPIFDAFDTIMVQMGMTGGSGDLLTTVFNGMATAITYLAPVIKIAASFLGQVYMSIAKVIGAVYQFVATSPRLQKFFSGLWSGAVATFKGIAEAAGKFLGGIGGILEGVFTGDFSKIKDGLKNTLMAVADGGTIAEKAGAGFADGYKKGFQKVSLFDVAAKAPGAGGANAATAFMAGGGKAAGATTLAPNMGAAKAVGAAGAGGSGSKVTHISIRNEALLKNVTVHAATAEGGVDQIVDMALKKLMGMLNDVNTLASA